MRLDKGTALSNPVCAQRNGFFCRHEPQLSRFQSLPGTCLGENKSYHEVHLFSFTAFHISSSHNFHFATIINPFSGQGSLPHRFYFPAAWFSPTASISRHQEPQSRLPPKVMVIQGRYYLVRTTQNRTHFLRLYTGIYAL